MTLLHDLQAALHLVEIVLRLLVLVALPVVLLVVVGGYTVFQITTCARGRYATERFRPYRPREPVGYRKAEGAVPTWFGRLLWKWFGGQL